MKSLLTIHNWNREDQCERNALHRPSAFCLLPQWGFVVFLWSHMMHFSPGSERCCPHCALCQEEPLFGFPGCTFTFKLFFMCLHLFCMFNCHTCSLQMLPAVIQQWCSMAPSTSRSIQTGRLINCSFILPRSSEFNREHSHWYYNFKTGSADRIQVRCWHTKHNCCQAVLRKCYLSLSPLQCFCQHWGEEAHLSKSEELDCRSRHSEQRWVSRLCPTLTLLIVIHFNPLCIFCVLSQHLLKWLLEELTERVGSGNQLHLQGSVWVSGRGLLASRSFCVSSFFLTAVLLVCLLCSAKIHNCSSSPQTGCQRCWWKQNVLRRKTRTTSSENILPQVPPLR